MIVRELDPTIGMEAIKRNLAVLGFKMTNAHNFKYAIINMPKILFYMNVEYEVEIEIRIFRLEQHNQRVLVTYSPSELVVCLI